MTLKLYEVSSDGDETMVLAEDEQQALRIFKADMLCGGELADTPSVTEVTAPGLICSTLL